MRSVAESVEWALQRCPSLVVDDACSASASSCTYPFPRRAAADVLTLEALVVAWREGLLTGSFGTAARAVYPGAYRSGVSESALSRYRRDYERIYQGRAVLLGPHVARSASGGTWRLCWYLDGDS